MRATRRGLLAGLAGVLTAFGAKPAGAAAESQLRASQAARGELEKLLVITPQHSLGIHVRVLDPWGNELRAKAYDLRSGVATALVVMGGRVPLRSSDGEPVTAAIAGCSVEPLPSAPEWARRLLWDLEIEATRYSGWRR